MEAKKNKNVDLEEKKNFHLTIGFVLSVSLVTLAFEWRTIHAPMINLPEPEHLTEVLPSVPVTEHKPPEPKAVEIKIVEVPDEEELIEDITFDLPTFDELIEDYPVIDRPEEELPEEILIKAEVDPSFPGRWAAFYQYASKHLKYPKPAMRDGIEGNVYVQFVVDTDGFLSDIKVFKGIGAGCDEEAVRVLKIHHNGILGNNVGVL